MKACASGFAAGLDIASPMPLHFIYESDHSDQPYSGRMTMLREKVCIISQYQ